MKSSAEVIAQCRDEGGAAVLAYLPLGFPTVDKSIQAAKVLIENGVDIIELGFPYSDPGMDGPVIQRAGVEALRAGTHLSDLFRAVGEITATGAPVVTMTYWNPVNWYGVERFAADFKQAGGSGLITPDIPPEEAGEWIEASTAQGLERIFLVAPSSSNERLKLISEASSGWVYAASTMGVTGARQDVDDAARELVERTRKAGADLVCVGLGVSTGAQARDIAEYADGVIVGSAFVRLLFQDDWDKALADAAALAQELKAGASGEGA